MISKQYHKVFEVVSVRGFTCLESDPEFEYSSLNRKYDTYEEAQSDLDSAFVDSDDEPRKFVILPILEITGDLI